jgi:hypothetical protein
MSIDLELIIQILGLIGAGALGKTILDYFLFRKSRKLKYTKDGVDVHEKFTRPYELIYFKDLHRYDVGEWIETTKNSRFFILSKSDEELLFVSELKAGYVNYHIHPDCMLEKFILLSGEYTLKVRNLITHEEWDKHVTEILEMLEVNSDEHHSIIVDENAILLGMLRRKK